MEADCVARGNQRISLHDLYAAGTKDGHRFLAKRKAYLSPRSIAFNAHGIRLAVNRMTGEIRILRGHIKPLIEALRSDRPIEPPMLVYLRHAIADLFEGKYVYKGKRGRPLKESNTPPGIREVELVTEIRRLQEENKKSRIPRPLLTACEQYARNKHPTADTQTISRYYKAAKATLRELGWLPRDAR